MKPWQIAVSVYPWAGKKAAGVVPLIDPDPYNIVADVKYIRLL